MGSVTTERQARPGTHAKGIRRRNEILAQALEVFATEGFEGTTLRSIAKALGISHAALTHYFPSREALLIEVLRTYGDISTRTWSENPDFMAAASRIATENAKVPGVIALHTSLLGSAVNPGNVDARTFFQDRFAEGRRSISERVRAGQQAGTIAADVDGEAIASLLMAAFDGLQIQWLLDQDVDIHATLALIGRLLASPAPGPAA